MNKYVLAEETLGYQTATDPSNTDKRLLIAGSQNVLVDFQKKVKTRPGYTRLGAANSALTPTLNGWTWNTSTGDQRPQRNYNGILEVYLRTIEGTAVNAWVQVGDGFDATKKIRPAVLFDATENIDIQPMVNGDANIYEWSGAVAVVGSVPDGTHVMKTGTNTWGQNRFYATRNKKFVCVRTGTGYTYTSGEDTTTLVVSDSTGLIAGDILVQKIVTQSASPGTRINDVPYAFENQLALGSFTDDLAYISKNSSYHDFAYSTPRVSGEGGLLTLDGTTRGISSLGSFLLVFSGLSSIFKADYQQLTVGSTLAETLRVKKVDVGVNKGALNHECIVAISDALAYLTNEVTLQIISNPENINGLDPKSYSNPIKPDFDVETWDKDNTFGIFYKNTLIYSAASASHVWMLNFVEDADGKAFRFWNPPQVLPVGAFAIIDSGSGPLLHGHSNSVPETYLLFDGTSDGQYTNMDPVDKVAIHAIAQYAYNHYGDRVNLKTFDEYEVEGEITPNTKDLVLTNLYEYDGAYQTVQRTIDGTDDGILGGLVNNNSLAQAALTQQPLGGLLVAPPSARRFRVIFEYPRDDFHEMGVKFETNDVDRYWSIIAHGANATLSPRRDTYIRR